MNELIPETFREINNIQFGILSPDEIRKMSVCEITSSKLDIKKKEVEGMSETENIKLFLNDDDLNDEKDNITTLYDERMGIGYSLKNNDTCKTCNLTIKSCPGHFGHIELNYPVIHPLCYQFITQILQCFCINCKCILINKDQIELKGLMKYKSEKRFEKISNIVIGKIDLCYNCHTSQPKISHKTSENIITMTYKYKKSDTNYNEKNISIELDVNEISKILENISDNDLKLLGFEPENIHPKNLIISVLPVLPPSTRPYVLADGKICDDDLTCHYAEIIKINNCLSKNNNNKQVLSEQKYQKYLSSLKFRIATLYDNSYGQAKHPTNGRVIKCIKKRLVSKTGLVRNNLMGKRVNFSARTVITPDATLKVDEMAIPPEIAQILTFPERVTSFNIEYLTGLVNNNKVNCIRKEKINGTYDTITLKYALNKKSTPLLYGDYLIRGDIDLKTDEKGDIIIPEDYNDLKQKKWNIFYIKDNNVEIKENDRIVRKGKFLKDIKYPSKNVISLDIGDVVERHLMDGDIVLLNRQPTLHKGGMIAMKVRIIPGKTFRFNLSICKSFNSDFDGDEMNIHPAQSLETKAELLMLSSVKNHIISPQESKNNLTIVQDSLLACYLLTKDNIEISRSSFYNISISGSHIDKSELWNNIKLKTITNVFRKFGKNPNPFTGKGLISLVLPHDFCYTNENRGTEQEPVLKIFNGVLYEGALNSTVLGSSHNSLIQILNKEYGSDYICNFIDNIHFLSNNWLLDKGFSIGLEDCMISSKKNTDSIRYNLTKCYIETQGIEESVQNPNIKEIRVTASLSKAKDIGLKIAKDGMKNNNNLLHTVSAGSKGSFFNIAQLTGLLGQQNINGSRVQPVLNNGKRTLVHYPFDITNKKTEYESKGFIRHSFIHGLNPQEFFFHSMSGREGVCDTATGTAKSGYIQRKIVKLSEDLQVQYDGSVRDTTGKIYQWCYNKGIDPLKQVKVNGELNFCNINRLSEKLNSKFEYNLENIKNN